MNHNQKLDGQLGRKADGITVSLASLERLKKMLTELDTTFESSLGLSSRAKDHQYQASADMLQTLRDNNLENLTPKTAAQLRSAITNIIDNSPIIKISTATALELGQQQAVIDWLHGVINDQLVVSFKVDSQLVGGMVLQTPKARYDFSISGGSAVARSLLQKKVAVA